LLHAPRVSRTPSQHAYNFVRGRTGAEASLSVPTQSTESCDEASTSQTEYRYLTEFQSHEPEVRTGLHP